MRAGCILQTRVQISSRDILTSKTPYGRVNLKAIFYVHTNVLGNILPQYLPMYLICLVGSAFLVEFDVEPMVVDI